MFKMNPDAKEFVPAHILKRRQEEAERLGDLTEQLNKVEINSNQEKETGKNIENGENSNCSTKATDADVIENRPHTQAETNNSKPEKNDEKSTSITNNTQENNHPICEVQNDNHQYINNNNNHNEGEYPEGLQEFIDEEDDRFLLNAGEDLCEFNGEQFIIPGDDDYEPPTRSGYDFGNAEDNEDEDVCNAFEEFLDNLPSQ